MRRDELTALIRTHQAELYRYLRYLGADRSSAEDLVQETFLAAFQSDVNLEPGASAAAAWLRGIARNLFLQWCRRNRTSPVRIDSETVERAEAARHSVFLRGGDGFDYVEALRRCYEGLSDRQRRLLDQRYGKKMSRARMAEAASMTENGIKSLLRRVRAALADCIKRRLRLAGASRG